jgi:hypothetical protein
MSEETCPSGCAAVPDGRQLCWVASAVRSASRVPCRDTPGTSPGSATPAIKQRRIAALLTLTLLSFCSSAAAQAQVQYTWQPRWDVGTYWIVESPRLWPKVDEMGNVTYEEKGVWRTRFTIVWPSRKYVSGDPVANILIEPSIPGEHGHGEHVEDHVVRVHRDRLRFINEYRVGTDAGGAPIVDHGSIGLDRQLGDPEPWCSSFVNVGDFPSSLFLCLPVFSAGADIDHVRIQDFAEESVQQTVAMDPDGTGRVRLVNPQMGLRGIPFSDVVLVFHSEGPWFDVEAGGKTWNEVIETGTRDVAMPTGE